MQVAVKKTILYKILKFKLVKLICIIIAFHNSLVNSHKGIIVTLKCKRIIESNLYNMDGLCTIVSSIAIYNPNDSGHVLYYIIVC